MSIEPNRFYSVEELLEFGYTNAEIRLLSDTLVKKGATLDEGILGGLALSYANKQKVRTDDKFVSALLFASSLGLSLTKVLATTNDDKPIVQTRMTEEGEDWVIPVNKISSYIRFKRPRRQKVNAPAAPAPSVSIRFISRTYIPDAIDSLLEQDAEEQLSTSRPNTSNAKLTSEYDEDDLLDIHDDTPVLTRYSCRPDDDSFELGLLFDRDDDELSLSVEDVVDERLDEDNEDSEEIIAHEQNTVVLTDEPRRRRSAFREDYTFDRLAKHDIVENEQFAQIMLDEMESMWNIALKFKSAYSILEQIILNRSDRPYKVIRRTGIKQEKALSILMDRAKQQSEIGQEDALRSVVAHEFARLFTDQTAREVALTIEDSLRTIIDAPKTNSRKLLQCIKDEYYGQASVQSIADAVQMMHYHQNSFTEQRKKIIRNNCRLVMSIARKTSRTRPLEDRVSDGLEGLNRALDTFDVEQGWKFSTYATWWIRQKITRSTQLTARTVRIPVHVLEVNKQIRRAEELLAKDERPITELAIAEYVNNEIRAKNEQRRKEGKSQVDYLTPDDVKHVRSSMRGTASLDMPIGQDTDTLYAMVPAQEESAIDFLAADEAKSFVGFLLNELSNRSRVIMQMRYGLSHDPLSVSQAARLIGIDDRRAMAAYKSLTEKLLHYDSDTGRGAQLSAMEVELHNLTQGVGGKPYTLERVGALFNVTRERVRQIENNALQKIQQRALSTHNPLF